MKEVKIDYSKIVDKIKPMNGVNNGPAGSRTRKTGNFESYEALKIPYARLHDASFYFGNYGGEFTVDVHRVFPDFSADENDENSYIFAPTDSYLQDIEAVGTEVFYRLGASIEHGYKKGTYPPKDFEKWARICERIIRHYNEGWANGFYMNIKYWEIWNEPDCHNHDGSAPCWQGSEELFWDFYEVAAKYLKGKFPSLKIGGPAFTGAWCSWADRFLEEMGKRKVPMDFYSFHCYAKTPEVFVEMVDYAVERINKFGYENAELILNEWNYVRGWTGDLFKYSIKSIKSLKGSAFASAVMLSCQKTPLSALMYYDARPCGFNGIFSTDGLEPLKTYYIFKNF
ncbi:MAG: hypothetical protein IJ800_05065, partial [Clostridia bacterium]|nr:hypothetical protein [Clostridia bacterium]